MGSVWRVCSATLKGTTAGEELGVWGNWCVEKGTTREDFPEEVLPELSLEEYVSQVKDRKSTRLNSSH